jgi:hypothetical protein
MGRYSVEGWKYYFPVVFILKTPLPLLLLLAATAFIRPLWTKERLLFVAWPAALFFLMSCFSKVQIGHRHILPVYPFLIVWVAAMGPLLRDGRIVRVAGAALLLWYCAGTIKVHPWYLSYFNELVGATDNGYRYLTDSNVDWGQGLKALGAYLKSEKVAGIYLDYFGTGDPHYYGIAYRPLGFVDNISYPWAQGHGDGDPVDFSRQPKTLFAISATNLQATYYADKNVFAWLKGVRPERIIAHSILVYDLGADPDKYRALRMMLAGGNRRRE